MSETESDIFSLSDKIQLFPVIHGSGSFTRTIRQKFLSSKSECLAVCLPPEFQSSVEEGIKKLPFITLSVLREKNGACSYVPIDPCQPIIMALRIAMQEGMYRAFIDLSTTDFEPRHHMFPDAFALRQLTYEKFCVSLLPTIIRPSPGSRHDKRTCWMAYQLHRLELEYSRITMICSFLDWPWIKEAYDERHNYSNPEPVEGIPNLYGLEKKTLFFALSELPYVTYLYERNRNELRSDQDTSIDGVKEVLLLARKIFIDKYKLRYHNLSLQTFQAYLQYVRNLTLMEDRLTPDLYTLVVAAKQIGGDSFAVALMKAARTYPFQKDETLLESLPLGIDQASFNNEEIVHMKNRLSETRFEWRSMNLKQETDYQQQQQWKYNWNPYGQCSWPPEDQKIESFNTHVREQTKLLLSNDLARSEKFTSSVKDGVDIRETVRHWYAGDIYVKEIPPSRGKVEIVIFLFEAEPDPKKYSWRQTWYAEHGEESTLCFFATKYLTKMIGPGIAEASYGGCLMIYPPRPIPNIWEDRRLCYSQTLEERLLEAAFFHSRERHVTVVAPCVPKISWRRLARQYRKLILHIPLSRFSNSTIEKIRRFHVLNGKEVRSFASRFIQEA